MKRVISLVTAVGSYLALVKNAFAQATTITIQKPKNAGYNDLGDFITASIRLLFAVAAVSVLIMLVWGALQWIFSGGEKEAVAAARNRILNALIGLAVLAVAVAIAVVFGRFVGIDLFNLIIPAPSAPNP